MKEIAHGQPDCNCIYKSWIEPDERTPSASTQHHQQQQLNKITTSFTKTSSIEKSRVRVISYLRLCTRFKQSSDHPPAKCTSAPSPSSPLWPPLSLLSVPAPGTMMLAAGLTPGILQPMLSTL
ncbi:unnamed protein product [Cercospora beticola]|nr:unnamed protein product [Cercospora beticola]